MVNFFEKFGRHKSFGTEGEGSGGGSAPKSAESAKSTIPKQELPGKNEKSPVAEAMNDCKNWKTQEEKVREFNAKRAFEYVSGDGMLALGVLIPRMLGKDMRGMRPDTFVLLLEKLSKDDLKTVFENLKQTESFHLLGDIAKRDSSLVNRLIALKENSGVDFGGKKATTDLGIEAGDFEYGEKQKEKIEKEIKELIEKIKKEHDYDVTPTEGDGKDTVEDLVELNSDILDARLFINDKLKGGERYREGGTFKHEFEEGGYKILFQRGDKELEGLEEEERNWINNLRKFEFETATAKFEKYLKAKYPDRFKEKVEKAKTQ